MTFSPEQLWSKINKKLCKMYGNNPSEMLLHTGAIGWVLSSLGQISGIITNNKISPEQKMFLIPQEGADAFVNIVSFYTLTSGVKFIGSKLARTAKICTKDVTKLLKDRGLVLEKGQLREHGKVYAGDWDFDITKLKHYKFNIDPVFEPFKKGVEVISALTGSIISTNIVTPVIRNYYAAKRQKDIIVQYNDWKSSSPDGFNGRKTVLNSFSKQTNFCAFPPGGNMKV